MFMIKFNLKTKILLFFIISLLIFLSGIITVISILQPSSIPASRHLFMFAALSSLGVIVISTLFYIILKHLIDAPIRDFKAGLKQVTDGNLRTRIKTVRGDEFGQLIKDFNAMTDTLCNYISEISLTETQLKQIAYYDELTGLLNRKSFYEKFAETLSQAKRHKVENIRGVIYIDLEHFNTVNDTFGHHIGDEVLIEASKRVKSCVRESDYVFRLGSDEFNIILNHLQEETDAVFVAKKLLESISQPFYIESNNIKIGANIGIAIYPKDGGDIETLMKNADTALYEAKKERNSYCFFTPEMQKKAQDRMQLINSMYRALENNEFVLYYQPQVNQEGLVTGAEALIRWQHPTLGFIPPLKFIPLAEESGLIVPIGSWVLETACAEMRRWHKMGLDDLTLSVNLSVNQFKDKDLIKHIKKSITNSDINPHYLHLEITESSLMEDFEQNVSKLNILREMGIKFSIDDFGTGYSSLSYLKKLPINTLKIDRSFVMDIPSDKEDSALVKTIISMAQEFGYELIAEGVESQEQANYLRSLKCDIIQGFLYSKPLPGEEFVRFVLEQKKKAA